MFEVYRGKTHIGSRCIFLHQEKYIASIASIFTIITHAFLTYLNRVLNKQDFGDYHCMSPTVIREKKTAPTNINS